MTLSILFEVVIHPAGTGNLPWKVSSQTFLTLLGFFGDFFLEKLQSLL